MISHWASFIPSSTSVDGSESANCSQCSAAWQASVVASWFSIATEHSIWRRQTAVTTSHHVAGVSPLSSPASAAEPLSTAASLFCVGVELLQAAVTIAIAKIMKHV